jgi:hypothetical protein
LALGGAAFAMGAAAGTAGAGFTTAGGTTAADLGGDGGFRAGRNASPAQPAKATADIHVDNRLSVLSTDVNDAMRTCWSNAAKSPAAYYLPLARQKCDLHSTAEP